MGAAETLPGAVMDIDSRKRKVETARAAVRGAFTIWRVPGASTAANFRGQERPKVDRRKHGLAHTKCFCSCGTCAEKGPHSVQQCSCATHERRLRREMGYDEHHAAATRPPGYSRPPREVEIMHGQVLRAIGSLDSVGFLWIQFRYRPQGEAKADFLRRFVRTYFARYEKEYLANARAETKRVVCHMVALAMEQELYPHRKVQPAGVGISKRGWNKTYRPHWIRITCDLPRLDADSLLKIHGQLILEDK